MGSKQTTEKVENRDPWAPAMPALTGVLNRATELGGNPNNFTPIVGQTTQNSINALGALGAQPSFGAGAITNAVNATQPGLTSGMNGLMTTAEGGYLGGNPYLDAVLGKGMQDTANAVNSQFSAAGRYGSAAQTGELTRQLGGLEMNARMGNYDTERGLQQQAQGLLGQYGLSGAALSPQADALKAAQIGYGLQAGSIEDANAMAKRNALNGITGNQYTASLAMPIGGMGGQSSGTSTVSQQPSTAAMIGGGLMSAAGMAMSPMPGAGTMGGAMFGKLMGG